MDTRHGEFAENLGAPFLRDGAPESTSPEGMPEDGVADTARMTHIADTFLAKAGSGQMVVAVIGLGYVGLPLSEAYVRAGTRVVGFDVNAKRVAQLNAGQSGMRHIDDARVASMRESGLFEATTDAAVLADADALLICVPTPLDRYHHPDLSYVEATCEMLKGHLREGHIVILESTTYPGTTQEVMRPILETSGLKAGADFALAYSPEREDPGNIDFETSTIPKLVGADSEPERRMAEAVYSGIVDTVTVPNTRTAEAAKLTENIFRWVNIGLVNELKLVFEAMDIDVWEVIDAAASKPFGFMAFYPGPGVGGHCIRVDPYYLTWKAREHGMSTRFIELAGEVNIFMPRRVVNRLMEELNQRHQKALASCRVLVCGVAYKKNIDDMRESPSLEVLKLLEDAGAEVDFYDPFIPEMGVSHDYPDFEGRKSIAWDPEVLATYDAVVITTPHTPVDYAVLAECVPLVVDTRNMTRDLPAHLQSKIAKA